MVDFPEPEPPTIPIFCPAGISKERPFRISLPRSYRNDTLSKIMLEDFASTYNGGALTLL